MILDWTLVHVCGCSWCLSESLREFESKRESVSEGEMRKKEGERQPTGFGEGFQEVGIPPKSKHR